MYGLVGKSEQRGSNNNTIRFEANVAIFCIARIVAITLPEYQHTSSHQDFRYTAWAETVKPVLEPGKVGQESIGGWLVWRLVLVLIACGLGGSIQTIDW